MVSFNVQFAQLFQRFDSRVINKDKILYEWLSDNDKDAVERPPRLSLSFL